MTNHRMEFEDLTVFVEVSNLYVQSPDPTCRDSDMDFHGYREMQGEIYAAIIYTEDGKSLEANHAALSKLNTAMGEEIETKLWEIYGTDAWDESMDF